MVARTWRGRAEWATLVAVIFLAGYFAQSQRAAADDGEAAAEIVVIAEVNDDDESADATDGIGGEIVVVAEVEVDDESTDGGKKAERKEIVVELRLGDKDIDVDALPTSKVIKRIIMLTGDGKHKLSVNDGQKAVEAALAGLADLPSHYIGIHAGEVDPVLAKHLKLDVGVGVVVLLVIDDSPAAKAGIKKHDIVVTANAKKIGELSDLVDLIREGTDEEVSLELIREGDKISFTVKPEKRPDDFQAGSVRTLFGGGNNQDKNFGGVWVDKGINVWVEEMKKAGKHGVPHAFRLRSVGPGLTVGGLHRGIGKMPGNLSVNISKNDDDTAKITVKQGDKTWEFEADDKEAMDKMPDETRNFVQRMLGHVGTHNSQGAHAYAYAMELPEFKFAVPGVPKPDLHFGPRDELIERLEAMEKQLKEVHEEFQKLRAESE